MTEQLHGAEQAFSRGDWDGALLQLEGSDRVGPAGARGQNLRGLIYRRLGRDHEAEEAFALGRRLSPDDPDLASNHGNVLARLGEVEGAFAAYASALASAPGHRDARYNQALLLQTQGRLREAEAELAGLRATRSDDVPAASAHGAVLLALDRPREAARAYEVALAGDPGRRTALAGRARASLLMGEPAADRFVAALGQNEGDPELVLGLAEALDAEGDDRAMAVLRQALAERPGWVAGHRMVARLSHEAGDPGFLNSFVEAMAVLPDDAPLRTAYVDTLRGAGLDQLALETLRSGPAQAEPTSSNMMLEAMVLVDLGRPGEALDLLDRRGLGLSLVAGRAALADGRVDRAETALRAVLRADPENVTAWAHLDLVWRLTAPERHEWLSGQPGLIRRFDLGLSASEIAGVATALRGLHRAGARPLGQSLRGGTQTRGRLFHRDEPELVDLRSRLDQTVRAYVAGWPKHDADHPLLRHRLSGFAMAGSWSVRLAGGGHHVGHVHPEGIASSALHIVVPSIDPTDAPQAGWLELGRPPAELGSALQPLYSFEPQPGALILFPSYVYHSTRPFDDGERLTVAFDLRPSD